MSEPVAAWLGDGKRLHLQHGPIDLIIEADGRPDEARLAYAQAARRFQTVLSELVQELPRLRCACPSSGLGLKSPVARLMQAAVQPLSSHRITPMAAVAGAVADEILRAMVAGRTLDRAYVNNGGDIALKLSKDHRFEIAMIGRPDCQNRLGSIKIETDDGIGGIATSGRHGRSHSLGIADAVTVLAANAASADAAATLIANAVDLPGHPAVKRASARDLSPDSDLGERLVTVDVAPLDQRETEFALDRGALFAQSLVAENLIKAAALSLREQRRLTGHLPAWRAIEKPPFTGINHPDTGTLEEMCFARG